MSTMAPKRRGRSAGRARPRKRAAAPSGRLPRAATAAGAATAAFGRAAGNAAAAVPPAWRTRALALVTAAALLAFGWFGWFRDSSFAKVEDVRVTGIDGPQAPAIRAALVEAARNMTTLNVREDELREAVEGYPTITSIRADGDFPHALTIAVREEPPVGAVAFGDQRVPVGHDGSLLKGVRYDHFLPLIGAPALPGADRIESGQAHRLLTVLVAAPDLMRRRIRDIRLRPRLGIVLRLRRGPDLIFGDATRLRAKWVAATRVLASQSAKGATYVDVRLPERPAAGGLAADSVSPTATPGADATSPAAPAGQATPGTTPVDPTAPVTPAPDPSAAPPGAATTTPAPAQTAPQGADAAAGAGTPQTAPGAGTSQP